MRGNRRARRGLTLIEALVATVLAATLVLGLTQILGANAGLQARVAAHAEAQALARTLLARAELRDDSGRTAGLTWSLLLSPSPYDPRGRTLDGFRLVRVDIAIDGPGLARGYRLSTERLLR